MKRIAWLTDVHLNFVIVGRQLYEFLETIRVNGPDAVLISGDTGEAKDFGLYLQEMQEVLECPVYFVLGNHDFYHGSIAAVLAETERIVQHAPRLCWLRQAGVISLTPQTGLVGHEGWADGRYGDYARSTITLNDYLLIRELAAVGKTDRLRLLNRLGDEAADHFRSVLPQALSTHEHVVLVTHPPPFPQACRHETQPTTDDWLPHMACKAVGDVLYDIMLRHPERRLTVLCGHTHTAADVRVLPNLRVIAGAAEYGLPTVQRWMEVE